MSLRFLADRAVIRLSGDDVAGFLQGLVTNDVTQPGGCYAALLSAQGKLLFDFFVSADGDDRLIDCEAIRAEALIKRLSMYRLRRNIAIALDEELCVGWLTSGDDGSPDPRLTALGHRYISKRLPDMIDASTAYHAHRLSLGVTEGVAELGEGELLWLECNAAELNGVSFTKGCYVGQENTARMNWRQKINRRLLVVPIAQSDPARQRIAYPDLGLAVDHRRVDSLAGVTLPEWLDDAINSANSDANSDN